MKAPIQKKLHALRKKVENIDKKIISLLSNRFLITKQIQSLKTELGEARTQKAREKMLIKRYIKSAAKLKVPKLLIKKIFPSIFSYAKKTGIIKRT